MLTNALISLIINNNKRYILQLATKDSYPLHFDNMVYMHFPHSLTEEEELLQRKYAKLRKKVGSAPATGPSPGIYNPPTVNERQRSRPPKTNLSRLFGTLHFSRTRAYLIFTNVHLISLKKYQHHEHGRGYSQSSSANYGKLNSYSQNNRSRYVFAEQLYEY